MSRLLVLLLPVIVAGCHARFKRHVGSIDDVRPQILVSSGPTANLGGVYASTDDAAANIAIGVLNVVQAVRSVEAADRIGEAVDVNGVNAAFFGGLEQALGAGPPFGTTPDPNASLLEVDVVSYGLETPAMGMESTFNYDLRVSIFLPSGKKVYNTHQSCNVTFGQASEVSRALGLVNNMKQLNDMTNEEIQASFEGAASFCGEQLAMRMRRHASSNHLDESVAATP